MAELTPSTFRQICPNLPEGRAAELLPLLGAACIEFQIDSPLRLAAFIAQMAHESGEFRYKEEIWGPTEQQLRYEPESALARRLGNTEPGDGHRYRGRGWIQLTGRANYKSAGEALGIDLITQPNLASTDGIAFRVAGWFWASRGLNMPADRGDMRTITKRINGGYRGYDARLSYYDRAKEALGIAEPEPTTPTGAIL